MGYISICTQINTLVAQKPYHYQIAILCSTILSATVPIFSTADLVALADVNTALRVSVTTLDTTVVTMQTTLLGKMLKGGIR